MYMLFSAFIVFLLDQSKIVSSLNILNHIDRNWSLKIDYATTGALPASSCFLIATHPGVMSRARKWTHFVHDLHKAWRACVKLACCPCLYSQPLIRLQVNQRQRTWIFMTHVLCFVCLLTFLCYRFNSNLFFSLKLKFYDLYLRLSNTFFHTKSIALRAPLSLSL